MTFSLIKKLLCLCHLKFANEWLFPADIIVYHYLLPFLLSTEIEDLTWVVSWDQQFLNEFNKVLFSVPLATLINTFWTSLKTVDLKRQRVSDSFSQIAIIAYFKELNRVLSAVTASSKNRYALSNSVTLHVILHVSKDKDFSTGCSNQGWGQLLDKVIN